MKEKLIIKKRGKLFAIRLDRIIFMEKDLRRIIVHTDAGDITFYGKNEDVKIYLDERFLTCHRSYLINMDKIEYIDYSGIHFENEAFIYMGRNKCREAMKEFDDYMKRNQ